MKLTFGIEDIAKSYRGMPVLAGCSARFDRPGVYCLTGPNGSGKSTLLRLCALLERPDSGRVRYLNSGHLLPADISLMRRITLVLSKVGLFRATVGGNVAYGLKVRGVPWRERKERVNRVLAQLGLSHKEKDPVFALSSGEAQRVGVARALVLMPEVLFLDEPTAFVDRESKGMIERTIMDMKEEGKSIVVLATHDRSQVKRLADRVFVMEDGKILET
ncbi:MAG: ABC transporter ATP-binding protein [Deltaproteobacteria bacterium]|nr:ABC transporter ATP-binding protein [Deltaproteobacteria bacterium]